VTFVSKRDERQRIEDVCAREGLEPVETLDEDDVSGGAPLSPRPGLRRALAMVEGGEAEVVVVACLEVALISFMSYCERA
jgi:DNA invertase Pin-like site-specific DNA recombinase